MNDRNTKLDRVDGAGPLSLEARKVLWERLWLRLLAPPISSTVDPASHQDGPADVTAGRQGAQPRTVGNRPRSEQSNWDGAHG